MSKFAINLALDHQHLNEQMMHGRLLETQIFKIKFEKGLSSCNKKKKRTEGIFFFGGGGFLGLNFSTDKIFRKT